METETVEPQLMCPLQGLGPESRAGEMRDTDMIVREQMLYTVAGLGEKGREGSQQGRSTLNPGCHFVPGTLVFTVQWSRILIFLYSSQVIAHENWEPKE